MWLETKAGGGWIWEARAVGRQEGRKGLQSAELPRCLQQASAMRRGHAGTCLTPEGGDLGGEECMCWGREVGASILTEVWVYPSILRRVQRACSVPNSGQLAINEMWPLITGDNRLLNGC